MMADPEAGHPTFTVFEFSWLEAGTSTGSSNLLKQHTHVSLSPVNQSINTSCSPKTLEEQCRRAQVFARDCGAPDPQIRESRQNHEPSSELTLRSHCLAKGLWQSSKH